MWLKKKRINGKYYYSIVHSYRQENKVKQKTVLSLGTIHTAYERLKDYPQYKHFLHELRGERTSPKYKIILVDPPWDKESGGGYRGAQVHYLLMSTRRIMDLAV